MQTEGEKRSLINTTYINEQADGLYITHVPGAITVLQEKAQNFRHQRCDSKFPHDK